MTRYAGVLVAVCLSVVLPECLDRWTVYTFSWLFEGSWTQIDWNETTFSSSQVTAAHVILPTGTTPPSELLQVFQGESDLGLVGRIERNASLVPIGVDARADIVLYDLTSLPPGEYTLVHRRASESPGRSSNVPADRWTTFQGEEALVNFLVVRASVGADAGAMGDAR